MADDKEEGEEWWMARRRSSFLVLNGSWLVYTGGRGGSDAVFYSPGADVRLPFTASKTLMDLCVDLSVC